MTSGKDSKQLSYRDAGVDIDAGEQLVENIKPLARSTKREGVLAGVGGFGALFEIPKRYRRPVLVTGTDGVGTKLKLASKIGKHDTIGIDLVAMSVNDILVQGAEPLFFLDYFSCGKLDVKVATEVVSGIARGCQLANCALIGGETAEMPGMYAEGDYDLAGFVVGAVEKTAIIDGSSIRPSDVVLGLGSSGPHSNGYSLIRRIVEQTGSDLSSAYGDQTLGETLLEPTRIYVNAVLAAMKETNIKGMAHITGGGLLDNVPRVLPGDVVAELHHDAWPRPPVFDWLQTSGKVAAAEMLRVFNCGIGMVLIAAEDDVDRLTGVLTDQGESVYRIGTVRERRGDDAQTIVL
ncbi:MAG: phosphoribosylformylglycinamidine cyclo-ligase [Betaproteobacteria bacterium]|nr:MAG: phosphoribosylformylglycinamidine cyclo-ligase [Betaproteobacteria bacterium]